jgi:hypothetical protein
LNSSIKPRTEGRTRVSGIRRRLPPQLNATPFLAFLWADTRHFLIAVGREIWNRGFGF